MFIIGLEVIKMVINEEVIFEDFGGVLIYFICFGVIHFIVSDDNDVIGIVRELVGLMFFNNLERVLVRPIFDLYDWFCDVFDMLVFENFSYFYDIVIVIEEVFDDGVFFEVQVDFVNNIVVGFG